MLIEGTREESGPLARALNEVGFAFPPLPNLFFPRDIGMVIGAPRGGRLDALRRPLDRGAADQGAVHAFIPSWPTRACCTTARRSGAATTRSRAATSTTCAPTCWCSASASAPRRRRWTSCATRCSPQGAVTDVLVVVMPKAPTAIHLDMIFTQVDRELCVVYPPFFVGPERLPVLHRRKGRPTACARCPTSSPRSARWACRWSRSSPAASTGPARSGSSGARPATSWRCGPGTIVSYRRNDATLCELAGGGLPGGAGGQLPGLRRLDRRQAPHRDHHRGQPSWPAAAAGPRCMSLPLRRARAVIGLVGPSREHAARPGARRRCARAPQRPPTLCHGCSACRARRTRCASGSPSRCSAPTRGCASSPTGAGGWCPRRRARRCSTTAPSRWWTSRPPGCGPAASDRITEIAVVVVHGGRREVVFDSLVNPGRPIPPAICAITNITNEMVRRRADASPRWPTRCWRRWPGGCSWPTTPGSTGTS